MLKAVSSITNAIGALNYKGTWNANSNSPALASSVGTKGDYYVVSTAGSTNLNGISNWGVGDLATFNGSVWQRVEGGADLNGVNLSVSGTTTLSNLTASTALALNASKEIVSVTNTGTGNNVLATTPTLVGDVALSTGNLVVSNGQGIDFSATPGTGTSELLADYEEGTFSPRFAGSTTAGTWAGYGFGTYRKVGKLVTIWWEISQDATHALTGAAGDLIISNLPFSQSGERGGISYSAFGGLTLSALANALYGQVSGTNIYLSIGNGGNNSTAITITTNYTTSSYVYGSAVYATAA